jgi:hypothetical protein
VRVGYPPMNVDDIIFLVLAVLSGSIALSLLIGGVLAFQNLDFSEKKKITLAEFADGLFFSSFFTAIYRVFKNWEKKKEERQYLYGCMLFTVITIVLSYFINF